MSSTAGRASASASASSTTPIAAASHSACTPRSAAVRSSAAPWKRATCAVVPYVRKLNSVNAPVSNVPAIARAASGATPRWPTIAVSTRM
jgi:hypothetical protein